MAETKNITIAVTPEQKELWEKCADSENRNLTGFVRNATSVYIAMLQLKQDKTRKSG